MPTPTVTPGPAGLAWRRDRPAHRARPAQPHRRRPRRQPRQADRGLRPGRRGRVRHRRLPRAVDHRLPAGGPRAQAAASSPTTGRRSTGSPPTPAAARRSSVSSTPTATSTTPPPCASTARVAGTYRKRLLPNYAVFDEARTFTPGTDNDPLELYEIAGVKVGISICEDIWSPFGPLATQAAGGAELSVNINGSPYHWEKDAGRERMVATRAAGRPHGDRLRQPGRRAGRARVRRRLVRGRRRRRPDRPRAAVRRGPVDRRPAGAGDLPPPPARPARQAHRRRAAGRAHQRRQPPAGEAL